MSGVFYSPDRVFKPGPVRSVYFAAFAASFMAIEVGRMVCRPYIYRNSIQDFGLADAVGNLLGTIAIVFSHLAAAQASRTQGLRIIGLVRV